MVRDKRQQHFLHTVFFRDHQFFCGTRPTSDEMDRRTDKLLIKIITHVSNLVVDINENDEMTIELMEGRSDGWTD